GRLALDRERARVDVRVLVGDLMEEVQVVARLPLGAVDRWIEERRERERRAVAVLRVQQHLLVLAAEVALRVAGADRVVARQDEQRRRRDPGHLVLERRYHENAAFARLEGDDR